MADESSFTSLLDESSSDEDEKVPDYSLRLKDALENLTQRFNAETLQHALQEWSSSCTDDFFNEETFSETITIAHRFLLQALSEIEETVKTNADRGSLDDIKRQLSICYELLNVWEKFMERVSKQQKTPAVKLKLLLENVLVTIRESFEHCKISTKLYGTLLKDVSEKLTNFFRKAKTISNLFLATLEGVIVFGTDTESETELLVKVIDEIGSIISIAHELDLKLFVETSKTFAKLAITYQNSIKQTKRSSVALHIERFTEHVTSILLSLQESPDKIDERKIKVIGHSLKILDRLYTVYYSCINKATVLSAIELLSQMQRCSCLCLQKSQIDEKISELISIHISRACEPFLNTLFKTSDFKQAFFEHESKKHINQLGYHVLTINIMKKFIAMPYEQHCQWILGSDSIIDIALTNLNRIQEEVLIGEVKLSGAHDIGERPRFAALYEATLVPVCSLISQIPGEGFHAVELLLLKHLLSGQLWSSLISADVWCFVGRIGSSELCASHVKYLLKVYSALVKRQNSLEVVMLESLIGRLYNLLSEEAKHSLVTELDNLENPSWIPVARFLPTKTKSFLQNRLACVLNEIPTTFADLQRQPTVQNWNRITTLMTVTGKLNYAGDRNTIDILSQIWNSIANTIEVFEDRQLGILSELISKSFDAVQPEKVQHDVFCTILEAVLTSYLCFPSHMKVIASHYLRKNINSFDACGVKIANALAELNCRLLEDENAWVRQEALESFDHVARMCPNEDLVTRMAAVVARRPFLSDSLPAYLSGTIYYEFRDFPDVRFYLQHVAKNCQDVCHVCYRYEEFERDEKLARLESHTSEVSVERSPLIDLNEHVHKICDELNDISKKTNDISDTVLRRLRLVCAKILNTIESSK